MKCVLSIKESNFNAKMGENFHICLQSGPRGGGVGIFFLLNTTLWGPNGWDTFQVFLKIRSTQEDFSRLFLMHGQIKLTWLF